MLLSTSKLIMALDKEKGICHSNDWISLLHPFLLNILNSHMVSDNLCSNVM